MVKVDWNTLTLKPSSGGLEQLVTNFSSLRFSSSVKPSTTSQKIWMTGWVAEYPPKGRENNIIQPELKCTLHFAPTYIQQIKFTSQLCRCVFVRPLNSTSGNV